MHGEIDEDRRVRAAGEFAFAAYAQSRYPAAARMTQQPPCRGKMGHLVFPQSGSVSMVPSVSYLFNPTAQQMSHLRTRFLLQLVAATCIVDLALRRARYWLESWGRAPVGLSIDAEASRLGRLVAGCVRQSDGALTGKGGCITSA